MVEVSRQSTFPPILRGYNPAITASFNSSSSPQRPRSPAKSSSKKSDHQLYEARSHPQALGAPAQSIKEHRSGKKRKDGGGNQKAGSSSGLLSADKIRREHELELRRKRNQVKLKKFNDKLISIRY